MAETAYVAGPELEQVDADTLPDDVKPEKGLPLFEFLDAGNLVAKLDKTEFTYSETMRLLGEAERSMEPWLRKYKKALDLAKLNPEHESKTFPFKGASTVMLPFLFEAMLDFHARTSPELVWANEVVGIKIYGRETEAKLQRSDRVSDYMNYQVSETMRTWRSDQDKLLLQLPCVGTGYKKTFYNADEKEAASDLYNGDELIFCHDYKTFELAPDKFLRETMTRNELLEHIRGDAKWKLEESEILERKDHPDDYEIIKAFTWVDLDGDGLTEPYEVVIFEELEKIVAVYPAYDEDCIFDNDDGQIVKVEMADLFTQYQFLPDPEGGPMGLGWGIILSDMFEALNTSVQQLEDGGTLSNLAANSGLIDAQMSAGSGRGNRQQAGPIEVKMGELTPITTGGKSLRESFAQFPFSGPNQTLFQLTEWLLDQIRGMTNSAINMDTNSQEAAAMYLARLQQGLKIPNSIVMRVYNSAQAEFRKLAALNYKHHSDKKYNQVLDLEQPANMRADFNPEDCDIRLAVDPAQGSDVEQQQRANMILAEAKEQPQQVLNLREAYLDWLKTLKVSDTERLAPEPSGEPDPMEQMMVANMQREAELAEREMAIKEAKLELERADQMMKAFENMGKHGLETDRSEAEIFQIYAAAWKNLWEIGALGDNPVDTTRTIEGSLIDKRESLPAPPKPQESPLANPPTQTSA